MIELLNHIKSIKKGSFTKKEKIVQAISNCIEDNELNIGDPLPSVNEMSTNLGYSRETVVKAYKTLKDRGIIDAKQGVGYFIATRKLDQEQTIALVLYGFQTFQQDFYNSFRDSLGKKYKIDVFFHHNNIKVYESILNTIQGNYSNYVVAPIQSKEAEDLLAPFPKEKILIIDRYQYVSDQVSKITQEFKQTMINVFESLLPDIIKYQRVVLFFDEAKDYPQGIFDATVEFCQKHDINFDVKKDFTHSLLRRGTLFFTVGDADLWRLIKCAKESDYTLGEDIGVLSHNDSPVKEIILDGITTFSTDFIQMGVDAAGFIKQKTFINKIVPSKLIKRKSL